MISSIRFANLEKHHSQQPSIRFLDIQPPQLESKGRDNDHGILGFCRVATEADSNSFKTANIFDDSFRKASSKGKKLATKVCQVLNQTAIKPLHRDEVRPNGIESVAVHLGDTAVVGGPPTEGRAKDIEGISWYQEIHFNFPGTSARPTSENFTSAQTLHFSCPTLKVEVGTLENFDRPSYNRVEILSGMCLFNAHILQLSLPKRGGVDLSVLKAQNSTLYEMEFIARSSSTISDLAIAIISKGRSSQQIPSTWLGQVRIHLDLPSFHYYHSVHEKLELGLCTCAEALSWISAIEKRYDQVSKVFEKAVWHELAQRGTSAGEFCEIRVAPRSNSVASSIRQALESGKRPSFAKVFEELNHQDDPTWQAFMKLLNPNEIPQDFRSLGYLFYVYQATRPALDTFQGQRVQLSDKGYQSRLLLFSVDDAAERRIYSRSQKLLKKIRQSTTSCVDPTLVEVYMSRRIFINRNIAGSNLYLDDPTPEKPICRYGGTQEKEVERKFLAPVDVIREIYGDGCACNLQKFFVETGL